MARLKDKVALITSAGVGIGRATARLFAEQGVKVVSAEINASTCEAAAQEVQARGDIISFTKSPASSYAKDGIRANGIYPGIILTDRVKNRVGNKYRGRYEIRT